MFLIFLARRDAHNALRTLRQRKLWLRLSLNTEFCHIEEQYGRKQWRGYLDRYCKQVIHIAFRELDVF